MKIDDTHTTILLWLKYGSKYYQHNLMLSKF